MKQRLLLALLMLFSSVGFMKVDAQISITLPQTKTAEDVTITFTSSTGKFSTTSYPVIGDDLTPTVNNTTATYKLKTKAQESRIL